MKRIALILSALIVLVVIMLVVKSPKDNSAQTVKMSVSDRILSLVGVKAQPAQPKKSEYAVPAEKLAYEDLGVYILTAWKTLPSVNDEAFLELEIRDITTNELKKAPGDLSVSVWNSFHGYGIVQPSVTAALDEDGKAISGVYHASGLYFLAAGQWEARVYLKKADGTEVHEILNVDLGQPEPNPMDDPNSPTSLMMKGVKMDHHMMHHKKSAEKEKEKEKAKEEAPKAAPKASDAAPAESDHSQHTGT